MVILRVKSGRVLSACFRVGFFVLSFASLSVSVESTAIADESPYRALLDDPFPNSIPPVKLLPDLYRWRGIESLPAGSKIEWDTESVQWSRVDERLVLPRARVKIEIPGVDGASLLVWSRTTPLRKSLKGSWFGEATVPLVSGVASKLSVLLKKGTSETEYPLYLERVAGEGSDSINIDSSCSAWHVEIARRPALGGEKLKAPAPSALLIADCRVVRNASAEGLLASLDLLLFVDGSGDELKMNGSTVRADAPSLFRIRLFPQNQPIVLESAIGDVYELRYSIPTKLNRGFVGIGFGPYRYHLAAPGIDLNTTAAVVTLYGSYQLSDSTYFTAFNATAVHKNFFTDTGFYIKSESVRLFDRRVTLYVMLGANLIGFKYGAETQKKWGAPQGFEAAYRDFLSPNRSLVFGAFVYPPIDGKSYYNAWIRYGSPSLFGELNYLGVRNRFENESVYVRSLGFSVGFPLARFF